MSLTVSSDFRSICTYIWLIQVILFSSIKEEDTRLTCYPEKLFEVTSLMNYDLLQKHQCNKPEKQNVIVKRHDPNGIIWGHWVKVIT